MIHQQKPDYPFAARHDGIQGQVWLKLLISETGDVESVEVISGVPILAEAAVKASKKIKYKPYFRNGEAVKVSTKLPFDFFFKDKVENKKTLADSSTASPDTPDRLQVSGGVTRGMLIHSVEPVYPEQALHYRIEGSVVIRAVIRKDGRIGDLTAISGPPQLISAAVGAVEQWRYRPYLVKGEPVEVQTEVTINFKLSGG
jgi:TonB family protein